MLAATRLTQFSTALVEANQNALVAHRQSWKLMPPNKYPVLLAEMSMSQYLLSS
jgi:hypothetical protein